MQMRQHLVTMGCEGEAVSPAALLWAPSPPDASHISNPKGAAGWQVNAACGHEGPSDTGPMEE